MKRARAHLEVCEDIDCSFCHQHDGYLRCCFGMRNNYGCINEDPSVKERCDELVGIVSQGIKVGIDDEVVDIINRQKEKVFCFVFNGHEYTASDSARNQSMCPHCGYKNPSGLMFRNGDNGVRFIGVKTFGKETAECFECESCYKKFFYHYFND